jgi:hypothetical protein
MTDKVVVRFLKAWRGYSADELAGFEENVVEGLMAKGFAEVYESGSAPKGKAKRGATKVATDKTSEQVNASAGPGTDANAGGENDNEEKP